MHTLLMRHPLKFTAHQPTTAYHALCGRGRHFVSAPCYSPHPFESLVSAYRSRDSSRSPPLRISEIRRNEEQTHTRQQNEQGRSYVMLRHVHLKLTDVGGLIGAFPAEIGVLVMNVACEVVLKLGDVSSFKRTVWARK